MVLGSHYFVVTMKSYRVSASFDWLLYQLWWHTMVCSQSPTCYHLLSLEVQEEAQAGVPVICIDFVTFTQKRSNEKDHHQLTGRQMKCVVQKHRMDLIHGIISAGVNFETVAIPPTAFDPTIRLTTEIDFDTKSCMF